MLQVRLTPEERERFGRAAAAAGLELAGWWRAAAQEAANEQLEAGAASAARSATWREEVDPQTGKSRRTLSFPLRVPDDVKARFEAAAAAAGVGTGAWLRACAAAASGRHSGGR